MSDRLITIREVCGIIGFGRTYVYAAIKKGEFPSPYKIGRKTIVRLNTFGAYYRASINKSS